MECKICKNTKNNKEYNIKEMMFGFRDEFTYFLCNQCQCLQIADISLDLSKYYPSIYFDYMSKDPPDLPPWPLPSWAATMTGGPLIRYWEVYSKSKIKDWESEITERAIAFYFNRVGISKNARILDVGCADASFLRSLRKIGFTNTLLGIDPYIDDIQYEDNVAVKKSTIFDIDPTQKWELIMLHHSFEHIQYPLKMLKAINNILATDGICLIRIPVLPCYAWDHYNVNWVSIDAPRHYFIFSPYSMKYLGEQSGLQLIDILYDSIALQFWGSEQYLRDIPFYSEKSWTIDPLKSIFSFIQIRKYEKMSEALNLKKQGDQAAFYFKKLNSYNIER